MTTKRRSRFWNAAVGSAAVSLGCLLVAGSSAASMGSGLAATETDAYTISASDVVTKAGAEGAIVVTVKAKGTYHVNDKYPHKVKVDDPPAGVDVPKRELKKDDGAFKDAQTFEVKIPVKAANAGQYRIGLEVRTSVCSATQCLMKKERLTANVSAK